MYIVRQYTTEFKCAVEDVGIFTYTRNLSKHTPGRAMYPMNAKCTG